MKISDLVRFTATRQPDVVALRCGDRQLTYRELYDQVCRLAQGLRQVAVPGDRVAILAENHIEYVVCYYAVPLAGMGLTFLNYRLTAREVADIVVDAAPSVLITDEKYLPVAREVVDATLSIHTILTIDTEQPGTRRFAELIDAGAPTEPDTPDDTLAWLIYTSGTTGRPKGAMLSHRNVVAAVCNSGIGWEKEDREVVSLFPWPLCHIAGYGVVVTHLLGQTLVLLTRYEPEPLLQAIQRYGVTDTTAAPTMLSLLMRDPSFERYDTSSIQRIGYGAAPMPVEVLRQAMQAFPNAKFATGFGMTELAGNVMYHSTDDHIRAAQGKDHLLASVGKPMPLSALGIVDDENREVSTGEVGELVVRGEQVTMGYWNRPDATVEAFQDGWFHTGDLARCDDEGYFYIVDRKKDMILTGGENVYSREVEEALYLHPSVAEAAAVGEPDEVWGERVVAIVQVRPGQEVDSQAIIDHCGERLAGFKRPRRVVFVDELPKNAAGKILKRELRTLVATRRPADSVV